MNHFIGSGNMVELLDSAARIVYTCSARQPHKNGRRALLVTLRPALTNVLAEGETMATNHFTTSPAGDASPQLSEHYQNNDIVTLPAMARHVSRATLLRLITHLQADRPASARVHSANVGDDGDGAE